MICSESIYRRPDLLYRPYTLSAKNSS